MAGRILDEDIQTLRQRADMALVVGDYTSLKRAGAKLKGLCPFHDEKTPSFTVDPGQGLFHCFGCGVGGDVYEFLMRAEALSFPEAVERLARVVGFELRYAEISPGARKSLGRRTRLTHVTAAAARWYAEQLHEPDADAARSYLTQRGLGPEDAAAFGLGWAPDRWDGVVRYLQSAGFGHDEITEAGLATQGQRGLIDRFRARVVFPIRDKTGKDVVAFGGRLVPGLAARTAGQDAPKYVNSPETPLYRKSDTLYGLDRARAEIQRHGSALVVEGYMDVIGLHRVGVRHAVATCGTALTAEHFRQLEHFTHRVVLALDADEAGFAAADRARALAEESGIRDIGVLPLPEGQDPADLAAGGEEAVRIALKATKTAVEFQIEHLLRTADVATPEGQVAAYRQTFPLLARLEDRFLRYSYIRDIVAPRVHMSADRIERELDEALSTRGARQAGVRARTEQAGARIAASAARSAPPGDVTTPAAPRDPQLVLEREVLLAALQCPDLLPTTWNEVVREDFRAPMSQQLFDVLRSAPREDLAAVLAALPDDETRSRVRALALSEPTAERSAGHVAELVARLRGAAVSRRIEQQREELGRLNERSDAHERRRLMAELYELERRRRDMLEGRDA